MTYDKPAKTYSQLIEGLKQKGLVIDTSESEIIELLKRNNYYSVVNGNKEIFLDDSKSEETFITGTTFNDLMAMYRLDQNIKDFLFQYILEIEVSIKSKLGYVVANNICS